MKKAQPKKTEDALVVVPDEHSLNTYVLKQWAYIEKNAYQGLPFLHSIQQLERYIEENIEEFKQGNLLPGFDWETDFSSAMTTHKFRKDWIEHTLLIRREYVGWWRDFTKDTYGQLQDIAMEARKLLLLSHGAAILGSMGALASISKADLHPAFLTVTIGGLVGFMLAAIGIVIHIESYGGAISKLHGDFRTTHPMRRYSAYTKYLNRRIKKEVRWSVYLSYASLIAFPVYSALAVTLAAFS